MKKALLLLPVTMTFVSASVASAVLVGEAFEYADLTVDPAAAWSDGGGSNIGFSRPNIGNTAQSQAALASVTNFSQGVDFSLTGSFQITNNDIGSSPTTTNRMSVFGLTLFGSTSDLNSGIFASLVISEGRSSYDAGQRLFLGTNRPDASISYVGNFPVNGTATSGGTFLTGSSTNLANGSTPTYSFTISVTYDNSSQADISFSLTDGTNSNSLTANDVDLTGYTTRNLFGITASERNRSLEGTFSNITINQVPEPSTIVLFAGAIGAALMVRNRRRTV